MAGRGRAWHGLSWQIEAGGAGRGTARQIRGRADRGRRGGAGRGLARRGRSRQAGRGGARRKVLPLGFEVDEIVVVRS
jgi:hypothetical protein